MYAQSRHFFLSSTFLSPVRSSLGLSQLLIISNKQSRVKMRVMSISFTLECEIETKFITLSYCTV